MTAGVAVAPLGDGARLGEALARARGRGGLVALTVPAPALPAHRLLSLGTEPAFFFASPGGEAVAGLGAAVEVTARGPGRFSALRVSAAEALSELRVVEVGGAARWAPRLYGGFAFAPGAADADPWRGFGDGRFVLPRWLYGRRGHRAFLVFTGHADRVAPAAVAREHDAIVAALATASEPPLPEVTRRLERPSAEAYRAHVAAILERVEAGEVDKIVAARRVELTLTTAVDAAAALGRLRRAHPTCATFAFRRGGRTFLGATPETLARVRGDRLDTEALAGTGGPGDRLDRDKERREHGVVVDAIAAALRPLCVALAIEDTPRLRALRDVVHMRTAVRATLRPGTHALDVAAALHPTPAVGGAPGPAARAYLATHEEPRGWYAAPVGWFAPGGDGELVVALRSALLEGERAHLFAGAGIVRGSCPRAEHEETSLKMRAVASALARGVHR